ncbi:hypothetical protein HK101_005804 [Irineochytrium annulatum]|nr:hypothetical protein HK101_005804 [Irineochytrium annulatum]
MTAQVDEGAEGVAAKDAHASLKLCERVAQARKLRQPLLPRTYDENGLIRSLITHNASVVPPMTSAPTTVGSSADDLDSLSDLDDGADDETSSNASALTWLNGSLPPSGSLHSYESLLAHLHPHKTPHRSWMSIHSRESQATTLTGLHDDDDESDVAEDLDVSPTAPDHAGSADACNDGGDDGMHRVRELDDAHLHRTPYLHTLALDLCLHTPLAIKHTPTIAAVPELEGLHQRHPAARWHRSDVGLHRRRHMPHPALVLPEIMDRIFRWLVISDAAQAQVRVAEGQQQENAATSGRGRRTWPRNYGLKLAYLYPCLLVCKSWSHQAMILLWTDPHFDTMERFVRFTSNFINLQFIGDVIRHYLMQRNATRLDRGMAGCLKAVAEDLHTASHRVMDALMSLDSPVKLGTDAAAAWAGGAGSGFTGWRDCGAFLRDPLQVRELQRHWSGTVTQLGWLAIKLTGGPFFLGDDGDAASFSVEKSSKLPTFLSPLRLLRATLASMYQLHPPHFHVDPSVAATAVSVDQDPLRKLLPTLFTTLNPFLLPAFLRRPYLSTCISDDLEADEHGAIHTGGATATTTKKRPPMNQGRHLIRALRCQRLPRITDNLLIPVLLSIPNLTTLELSQCELLTDDSLAACARHCPRLARVRLIRCPRLTDRSLLAIARWVGRGLTELAVVGCGAVSGVGVCEVVAVGTSIRTLEVGRGGRAALGDTIMARGVGSRALRRVVLQGSELTDAGVARLLGLRIELSVDGGVVGFASRKEESEEAEEEARKAIRDDRDITVERRRYRSRRGPAAAVAAEGHAPTHKPKRKHRRRGEKIERLNLNFCPITDWSIQMIEEECLSLRLLEIKV